jgi:RNA recognition motif-containing protein
MIPGYPITYYSIADHPFQQSTLSDDAGKIFVGGIPADASKETLTEYFSQFGDVSDCIIMVDNITGRSRGFGFVTFIDPIAVTKVLQHMRHTINGKVVDAKRAVPKGPNQGSILRAMGITSNRADRNPECKIFVGGVAQGTTESDLETHFKDFGKVLEVKIPKDQNTQRARGFSFVLFESPDGVINATKERFHKVNGKMVEVKIVQLQPNKGSSDKLSDDGRPLQSPPSSPYIPQMSRGGYYQQSPYNYIGLSTTMPSGYFEQQYEPSPSGSTGSPGSIGSAGFGNVGPNAAGGAAVSAQPQRLDEYSYMTPLYPAINDLSISQQYPRLRNKYYGYPTATIQRAQYPFAPAGAAAAAAAGSADQHLPATYTPSAAAGVTPSSVAFHSDPSGVYGGSTSPMYATISPHAQQLAQYAPTTSQSVVSAAYTR